MAKGHDVDGGSLIWNLVKLFVTLALFGGFAYTVKSVMAAWKSAVTSTKDSLAHQGVSISSKGYAYPTAWSFQATLPSSFPTPHDPLIDLVLVINLHSVAVKTDKRQVTAEETADKMRSGLMKGWKASTFKVPSSLAHASNLAGSTHDKEKSDWEAKHGPKKHKNHVE
ncbi:BQ2448_5506 [Microbotryum intermedium]|uniref:BQ2448_5506 protein n=1 Tax=Microbotryum intermedium TaxID=269621 RepID=A0A238F4D1_9BASI|nr:BQ2448_5506 [Microbotryum intermedium]